MWRWRYRQSIYGRPGAAYLDIADDIITGSCDADKVDEVAKCPDPPRTQTMPMDIEQALDVLQSAERPLVLIGKGMGYSRAPRTRCARSSSGPRSRSCAPRRARA